jgi:hypothetical protein
VVETFVRSTTELFHLTIAGATVSTTAEHPFMVHGRGWVDAAFLRVGDLLVTPEGATTPVEAIETEQRADAEAETVYNFHVETHSNYYVYAGATPVLVHNADHTHGGLTDSDRIEDAVDIARGHADAKHASEFPGMSADDLGRHVTDVMSNPSRAKDLSRLRRAFQGRDGSTVVVHDPMHPDGGTVFNRSNDIDEYWGSLT